MNYACFKKGACLLFKGVFNRKSNVFVLDFFSCQLKRLYETFVEAFTLSCSENFVKFAENTQTQTFGDDKGCITKQGHRCI